MGVGAGNRGSYLDRGKGGFAYSGDQLNRPLTVAELVFDLAITTTKLCVQTGASYAMNRALGIVVVRKTKNRTIAADENYLDGSNDNVAKDSTWESTDAGNNPNNPVLDGTQKGRRKGVVLTEGLYATETGPVTFEQQEFKEGKDIDYNDLCFGKVRGLFTVPILRGLFEIHDVMGFDVSFLHKSICPTRPYMTACKPYGDWAAETGPLWMGNRGLLVCLCLSLRLSISLEEV